MKHTLRILTALLIFCSGSAVAQVRVQVNGDQTFVIDEHNGLYFNNDTMRVDDVIYALDDIQVITLQQVTAGIRDIDSDDMLLVPNPARDIVTLNGIGTTPQKAILYSTAGVKLMEQTVTDGAILNISHLPEGLYILRCGNRMAKIVKQL